MLLFLNLGCSSSSPEVGLEEPGTDTASATVQAAIPAHLPLIDTGFDIDYIMGKFEPAGHPDFERIDAQYAGREGMYLRKDAYQAFRRMYEAARADGLRLAILSATRNFEAQKSIWEAKWTGARKVQGGENLAETTPDPAARALKILQYSSMPGTSRHHWGTDIDLNSLNNDFFKAGEGATIYAWLTAHAAGYGFCQPYTEKGAERPHGYNEERWHWSYMPVSRQLTQLAGERLTNDMIQGFQGAGTAAQIDVVRKYILGVNAGCK